MRKFVFENSTLTMGIVPALAIVSLLLPLPVSAEEPSNSLEEVVVTARKREESMQSVPMAVSAFNAEQLTNSQVDNITDLERIKEMGAADLLWSYKVLQEPTRPSRPSRAPYWRRD